jgi:membrane protein YdbS with pleckstrin-like domain
MNETQQTAAFDPILNKGEMIQAIYKPKKARFVFGPLFGWTFFALVMSMWPIFVFGFDRKNSAGDVVSPAQPLLAWLLFAGLFVLIMLLLLLGLLLSYKHVLYAYTNSRILIRSGLIGVDFKTLDLKQIQATEVRVDFIDKLTGGKTGSIAFGSNSSPMVSANNNSSAGVFRFTGILDPYGTLKTIKEAIEASK